MIALERVSLCSEEVEAAGCKPRINFNLECECLDDSWDIPSESDIQQCHEAISKLIVEVEACQEYKESMLHILEQVKLPRNRWSKAYHRFFESAKWALQAEAWEETPWLPYELELGVSHFVALRPCAQRG